MGAAHAQQGKFVKVGECLYRYSSSGTYYVVVRHAGKLIRRSLETTDKALAKRKVTAFKQGLEKTDPKVGNVTLLEASDRYLAACKNQAAKTLRRKKDIVDRIRRDWPGGADILIRKVKASHVAQWLAGYSFGWASQHLYIECIRAIFDLAEDDGLIVSNPTRARTIKRKKREKRVQLTPTWDEYLRILADVRSQPYNADAAETADFLEYQCLAGQGQAEACSLRWRDIHWESGFVSSFRVKTGTRFAFPIYPQLRGFLERRQKMCAASPDDLVFRIKDAKKALAAACKRLGLPAYSQRSLRRLFVTLALQKGVDAKTVASWQGHQDGGKLIFSTYGHLFDEHTSRMANRLCGPE